MTIRYRKGLYYGKIKGRGHVSLYLTAIQASAMMSLYRTNQLELESLVFVKDLTKHQIEARDEAVL